MKRQFNASLYEICGIAGIFMLQAHAQERPMISPSDSEPVEPQLSAGLDSGALPSPRLPPTSHEAIVGNANAFLDRVEALGFELPYRPELREWTRPSLISWREEARAVAIPRWEDIPPEARGQLAQWSSTSAARGLFEWSFRWFLPLHELAHFLQAELGAARNHSADEQLADDLAAAFWRTQPDGIEHLKTFQRLVEHAVAASPDPAPPGEDPRRYFDAHYDELSRDPARYGAYQWRFLLDSLRKADRLDFDSLILGILGKNGIPAAVALDPALDVGFHVAAHLHLPDVAISVFDPAYIEQIAQARKQLGATDDRLTVAAKDLSARLNRQWHVHQLVRLPALFPDFRSARTAFGFLLGDIPISPAPDNEAIRKRLDSFLSLYPHLKTLSDSEKNLARQLIDLIQHEFDDFYPRFHQLNRENWDQTRRRFRDAWRQQIAPAMASLDASHRIREVVIVLSPALRRHGKSYRVREGVGRVATLLPQSPEELERALLYAFHEMCHGVSDRLVYEAGHDPAELSYKHGEQGKTLHVLIEAAADQAMFEALGRTNPQLQERFLSGFGNLSWLAKGGLLQEQLALAGHELSEQELSRLRMGLEQNPVETSRMIYARGLRVSEKTLQGLRAR